MLYFVKYQTGYKIEEWSYNINNVNFTPLTEEQILFYNLNPTASIQEIRNCQLIQPDIIDLEIIKEDLKMYIKDMSRLGLNSVVDTEAFCDSIAGYVYAGSRDIPSPISKEQVLESADNYLIYSKLCKDKCEEYFLQIDRATSENELKSIETQAIEWFNNISQHGDSLFLHKQAKLREIDLYDTSKYVNGFIYNGILMWLDKTTRNSLVNTLNSATLLGRETIDIWFNGTPFSFQVSTAKNLLAALELYASDCYSVTAMHKAQIENMNDKDLIDSFDVTQDYPQMLVFNTEE